MKHIVAIMLVIVALFTTALMAAHEVYAAPNLTFTVNTTEDDTDANVGNGRCDAKLLQLGDQCTLRAAIMEANSTPTTPDTINLPAGQFKLTRVGSDSNAKKGDLDIIGPLTIVGAGDQSGGTTIDGRGSTTHDRVFEVWSGIVTLQNLRILGGDTSSGNTGAGLEIHSGATVHTNRVRISNNHAGTFTAGIDNQGTLNMVNSIVDHNAATSGTGGIENSGHLTIVNSVFFDNGIGLLTHHNQTSDSVIINSTFSGSVSGDRITFAGGTAALRNVTISGTLSSQDAAGGTGGVGLMNSIVIRCEGPMTSLGYNIIADATDCAVGGNLAGNLIGVSPQLHVFGMLLEADGSLSFGHTLLSGSPALDAGNPTGCVGKNGALLTQDQLSNLRPIDGNGDGVIRCDMGAIEMQAVGIGAVSPDHGSSKVGAPVTFDLDWTSPTRWRDLDTLDVRFTRNHKVILWLRFTEGLPKSTFSLLDKDGNVIATGNAGDTGVLKTRQGTLDLSQSGFTASGPDDPHVVIHFAIKFKKAAIGKLQTEMLAGDDAAHAQGPEFGGNWRVTAAK